MSWDVWKSKVCTWLFLIVITCTCVSVAIAYLYAVGSAGFLSLSNHRFCSSLL